MAQLLREAEEDNLKEARTRNNKEDNKEVKVRNKKDIKESKLVM